MKYPLRHGRWYDRTRFPFFTKQSMVGLHLSITSITQNHITLVMKPWYVFPCISKIPSSSTVLKGGLDKLSRSPFQILTAISVPSLHNFLLLSRIKMPASKTSSPPSSATDGRDVRRRVIKACQRCRLKKCKVITAT